MCSPSFCWYGPSFLISTWWIIRSTNINSLPLWWSKLLKFLLLSLEETDSWCCCDTPLAIFVNVASSPLTQYGSLHGSNLDLLNTIRNIFMHTLSMLDIYSLFGKLNSTVTEIIHIPAISLWKYGGVSYVSSRTCYWSQNAPDCFCRFQIGAILYRTTQANM